jgi:hypothetical protein
MLGSIKNLNALYRAEIVSVVVSTVIYGFTLYMTGNFKSAALASGIAVVVAALGILTRASIAAATGAAAAIAIAIVIALAAASIAAGALLAQAPIPTPTPPPAVIAAFAALFVILFAGIAVFSTTRRAAEMNITKTWAAISTLIEISVILAAFYTLSRIIR